MRQIPRWFVRILARRSSFGLLVLFSVLCLRLGAQNPTSPENAAPQPAKPAEASPAQSGSAEVVTRDSAATFKVRVNLVLVRVVVRDEHGTVVENLKKEDFLLFDNRKPQNISLRYGSRRPKFLIH